MMPLFDPITGTDNRNSPEFLQGLEIWKLMNSTGTPPIPQDSRPGQGLKKDIRVDGMKWFMDRNREYFQDPGDSSEIYYQNPITGQWTYRDGTPMPNAIEVPSQLDTLFTVTTQPGTVGKPDSPVPNLGQTGLPPIPNFGGIDVNYMPGFGGAQTPTTGGVVGAQPPAMPSLGAGNQISTGTEYRFGNVQNMGTAPTNPMAKMFPQGWPSLGDNYASMFNSQ